MITLKINVITDVGAALKRLKKLPLPVSASMLDAVEQLSRPAVFCSGSLTSSFMSSPVPPPLLPPTQHHHHHLHSHMTQAVSSLGHTHTHTLQPSQRKKAGRMEKKMKGGDRMWAEEEEERRRRCGSITGVTSHHDLLPSIPPSLLPIAHARTHTHTHQ